MPEETRDMDFVLRKFGFDKEPQKAKGDHIKFTKKFQKDDAKHKVVTVLDSGPKEIPKQILPLMLRQIGISKKEFGKAKSCTYSKEDYCESIIQKVFST